VAFHAHPDDESLLTGGTLARAAAQGCRVVLVVATAGELGLAADTSALAERRTTELERAAQCLGVARIVMLGYGDSGFGTRRTTPPGSFCEVPTAVAADRVAAVLAEENADVLTVYDAAGGYGHRDHLHVRAVGLAAAAAAGTPLVLAATVEREALLRAVRLVNRFGIRVGGMTPELLAGTFAARADITHEIDVRPWVRVKQAALRAHASQTAGGSDTRTVRLLARLPPPLATAVLGREWFVEVGPPFDRHPRAARRNDPFASIRDPLPS
jgi:LmbE family N-acetylglucosaminyl deacetylase